MCMRKKSEIPENYCHQRLLLFLFLLLFMDCLRLDHFLFHLGPLCLRKRTVSRCNVAVLQDPPDFVNGILIEQVYFHHHAASSNLGKFLQSKKSTIVSALQYRFIGILIYILKDGQPQKGRRQVPEPNAILIAHIETPPCPSTGSILPLRHWQWWPPPCHPTLMASTPTLQVLHGTKIQAMTIPSMSLTSQAPTSGASWPIDDHCPRPRTPQPPCRCHYQSPQPPCPQPQC